MEFMIPVYVETFAIPFDLRIPKHVFVTRNGEDGELCPDYPENASVADRLATFVNWKFDDKPNPNLHSKFMAENGFFSIQDDDKVICFYCGMGMEKFFDDENPIVGHAKFNPDCPFHYIRQNYNLFTVEEPQFKETKENKELLEFTEQLLDEKRCKVCKVYKATFAYAPCYHVATCRDCCTSFSKCPVCRKRIELIIAVHL